MKSMIIEELSNRVNVIKCYRIGYSQWSCHNRSFIIKRYYDLCTSKEHIRHEEDPTHPILAKELTKFLFPDDLYLHGLEGKR
jgi:hypothetical protein